MSHQSLTPSPPPAGDGGSGFFGSGFFGSGMMGGGAPPPRLSPPFAPPPSPACVCGNDPTKYATAGDPTTCFGANDVTNLE
eukprot:5752569-Prymnesium_polylepis.1